MNAVFADTFYYLALLSQTDAAHEQAIDLSRSLRSRIVTTAWVLTELGDALAAPQQRGVFLPLLDRLVADLDVTVVPPSEELFQRGVELYARRADKAWSLTDCISFVVMNDQGLSEALTGDRHFEQAGYTLLLR